MTESTFLHLIPAVDQLCKNPLIVELFKKYSRELVVDEIRTNLNRLRESILTEKLDSEKLKIQIKNLPTLVKYSLEKHLTPSIKRVINATGVIIHTNLGRAPISTTITKKALQLANGYSNLELDLGTGSRSHRDRHLETLLKNLVGCHSSTVCNNNAADLLLILNTFARGKKVLVSRGELVEIGGAFRIPDIMKKSGARLKEVGTTNKTKMEDFAEAVDEETGLILSVHTSNYRIVGFTQSPTLEQLIEISSDTNIPLVHDVGSGLLFDSPHTVLREEPSVQSSLSKGTGLVCFSGDKVLGGPQAGIIVGKRVLVEKVRKNPMMRALRIDKITYSLLEGTLLEYVQKKETKTIEVMRMILTSNSELQKRTEKLAIRLQNEKLRVDIQEAESLVGGGAAPCQRISGPVLKLKSKDYTPDKLTNFLRSNHPPIIARIENAHLMIDLRTVLNGEEKASALALKKLTAS